MKKRELRKLPQMKATEEMKKAAREDKGHMAKRYNGADIWVPDLVWFYRAKQTKEVLELDVFTRDMLLEGYDKPKYRIFLHDEKYDTWDNLKETWRKATITRLEYEEYDRKKEWYWYCEHGVWMKEKEQKLLDSFLKNGIGDPMAAVQVYQDYKKNQSELDRIEAEMRLVPKLPKDFDHWILTDGLPQYIFYDAGRNVKEGYCTACKNTVSITKPKYNKKGICPNCKRSITFKSRKKAGNMIDEGYVGILQKTREGFVYRYFYVKQKYKNGFREWGGCWEEIRQTYDQEFRERNEFEYSRYKQTNQIRWHYKGHEWNEKVVEHQAILYWRNLKQLLKGTKMQYSAIEIYARQKRPFFPENYIEKYQCKPGIEQLVKCGFFNLVSACIGYYGTNRYLRMDEKSTLKILGLKKPYYNVLKDMDPTVREYEVIWEFQEFGILPKEETVRYLAEHDRGRNFAIYIRHTTEHKMLRYMKEKLENNKLEISDYHDYLQMAAGLGYDMNDEYILYPKNLKQRHDQYVEERRERDKEMKHMQDEQKKELYQKMVKEKGWTTYEMEQEDILVRLPKSPAEIREEGNSQHHCVSGYIDRMIEGRTCILLIRRKEEPEESFYTMEVKDERVVQVRGKYNASPTEEINQFVERFKKTKLGRERVAG